MQAAMVDLEDRRGNTKEGIHGASAGGVWQAVTFGFGGIQLTENGPVANPHLPPGWTRLKFKLHWRGKWHEFDLRPRQIAQEIAKELQFLQRSLSPNPPRANSLDIRGVIFDLDGVLTDTAEYHYLAWQKLADDEGIPFNRQDNEALRGVSRRASLMLIIKDLKYTEAQIKDDGAQKPLLYRVDPKHYTQGFVAGCDRAFR